MNDPETVIARTTAIEINSLHRELCALGKTTLEKAIRIGRLLAEEKAKLNHGEWLPWITANLEFTDQTARNYIRVYEKRDDPKFKSVLNLTQAYALLNEKSAGETLIAALTEVLQLLTEADALQDEDLQNPDLGAKPNPDVCPMVEVGTQLLKELDRTLIEDPTLTLVDLVTIRRTAINIINKASAFSLKAERRLGQILTLLKQAGVVAREGSSQ